MRGAFGLFSLRPLWRKKVRVALCAASVSIGVAAFVATAGANRAVVVAMRESAEAVSGKTDLEVRSPTRSVPRTLLETVRAVEGVEAAVPLSEFTIRVTDPPGIGQVLAIGVDLLDDALVRAYRGAGSIEALNPLALLAGDGALVTTRLAEEGNLGPGASFEVASRTGKRRLRVAGVLAPEGAARAFGARVLVLPIGLAESLLGTPGKCGLIEVVLSPGVDLEAARARLAAAVGPLFEVGPPEWGRVQIDAVLGTLRILITLTSLIALGVAVFLVYNSAALSSAERAREFGLLRALGATRLRILLLFVGESTAIGFLGAIPGVALGAAISRGATRLFVEDVASSYFTVPEVRSSVTPGEVLVGLLAGVVASALASLLPAVSIGRIAPVEALREEIRHDPLRLRNPVRVVLSLLALGVAVGAHLLGPERLTGAGWFVAAGLTAALVLGAWPASRLLASPLGAALRAASPVPGRLATDGFLRSPGRIGFTVVALAAGFGLAVHVSLVAASFRSAIDGWVARTLGGDLWVFYGGFLGSSTGTDPFGPEVLDEVRAVPGVRQADAARVRMVPFRGADVMLTAFDAATHPARGRFEYRSGDEETMLRELPGRRAILASEGFAHNFDVRAGGTVRLATAKGEVEYRVAGIVVDYGWPRGVILMDRAVYREDFEDPLLDDCIVLLGEGADREVVRRTIEERLRERYGAIVMSIEEFRAAVRGILERVFSFTRAQTAATILLAFLGVVNAAWIGALVRTRELGLLRAIGAPGSAVFRIVAFEAILVGIVGGALGVAVGAAISENVVSGLSLEINGFSVPLVVPVGPVLWLFSGCVLASAAAALLPARRAARLEVLPAIAYE